MEASHARNGWDNPDMKTFNALEAKRLGQGWDRLGQKDHLRRAKLPITAWDALVWAFRTEHARAIGGAFVARKHRGPGIAQQQWELAGTKATIDGLWQGHEDAVAIDGLVKSVIDLYVRRGAGEVYVRIAQGAERAVPIAAKVILPDRRPVPVLVNTGRGLGPKVEITPAGRRPWFCPVDWEGPTEEERQAIERAHAVIHEVFLAVLDALQGLALARWTVTGRGLS